MIILYTQNQTQTAPLSQNPERVPCDPRRPPASAPAQGRYDGHLVAVADLERDAGQDVVLVVGQDEGAGHGVQRERLGDALHELGLGGVGRHPGQHSLRRPRQLPGGREQQHAQAHPAAVDVLPRRHAEGVGRAAAAAVALVSGRVASRVFDEAVSRYISNCPAPSFSLSPRLSPSRGPARRLLPTASAAADGNRLLAVRSEKTIGWALSALGWSHNTARPQQPLKFSLGPRITRF